MAGEFTTVVGLTKVGEVRMYTKKTSPLAPFLVVEKRYITLEFSSYLSNHTNI